MMSTSIRQKAEQAAKVYMEMRGYDVVEQNYRRGRFKIDMVVKKYETTYFVEIGYSPSDMHDSSLGYLTPTKVREMRLAAELWIEEYKWRGDYRLSAIEVAGKDFVILSFTENVL